jgi:hypothetical protein
MRNTEISFAKAIEMTENALSEVGRLAVEQIRRGAETSSHIEAAERDLRGALRQLVLAEREGALRAGSEGVRNLGEVRRGVGESARAAVGEARAEPPNALA